MLPLLLSNLTWKHLVTSAVVAALSGLLIASHCELGTVRGELKTQEEQTRERLMELANITANRDQLLDALDLQNRAVKNLEQNAALMELAASERASTTLRAGKTRRRSILDDSDAGTGPEEVNAWLQGSFSPWR